MGGCLELLLQRQMPKMRNEGYRALQEHGSGAHKVAEFKNQGALDATGFQAR